MPWIQSHTEQENSPKVIEFRHLMGWDKNAAIGFLLRFRLQVLQIAPNGDVADLRPVILAEVLAMEKGAVERALEAMEEVGLLVRKGDRLLVTDWLKDVGRYLKDSLWKRHPERMADAETMHGLSVDSPKPARDLAEDGARRFKEPTVEDVAAYCAERKNSVNAQQFVDFYASKGWKVGAQTMKDWKAAVRTWEQRSIAAAAKPAEARGKRREGEYGERI